MNAVRLMVQCFPYNGFLLEAVYFTFTLLLVI